MELIMGKNQDWVIGNPSKGIYLKIVQGAWLLIEVGYDEAQGFDDAEMATDALEDVKAKYPSQAAEVTVWARKWSCELSSVPCQVMGKDHTFVRVSSAGTCTGDAIYECTECGAQEER